MAKVTLSIDKSEGLRLYGPLSLKVLKGTISILGAELKSGDEVEIKPYRSYSVLSLEHSEIEVNVKEGGKIEFPAKESHYLKWIELADTILDSIERPSTIAVLGPVESGKTSYTALLANRALSKGLAPAILDADIGQADIGPPGFISLSYPTGWVTWLRELSPVAMRFIGSIEPSPVMGKLISGMIRLIKKALSDGLGVVAVDTDGWVQGIQAMEAKVDILDSVNVDVSVVLGDNVLYSFLRKALDAPVYLLPSPEVRIVRDISDRKFLRRENYKRFIGKVEREIDLSKVSIKGSCLLGGIRLNDHNIRKMVIEALNARILAITELPGVICIGIDSEEPPENQNIRSLQRKLNKDIIVVYKGGFKRVLSALRDPEGYDHPAILVDIDLSEEKAKFITNYEGEVREVVFSRIRLSESFEEIRGRIWI